MLKQFIRFTNVDYCLPDQEDCLEPEVVSECSSQEVYYMPAKSDDVINFIVDRDQTQGFSYESVKVALVNCGIVTHYDIGIVTEADSQIYVSVTMPEDLQDCDYQLVLYLRFTLYVSAFTPESSEGECDGVVTIGIFGDPLGSFSYSIDGITYQESPTFENVCAQDYTFYLREGASDCEVAQLTAHLGGTDCSQYSGTTIQDLIDLGVYGYWIDGCTGNDFI
jgi:hypothetical protein